VTAAALQQVAVPRQHDASLRGCHALYLVIIEVAVVQSVEARHAQQVGEAAQVRVGDEAGLAQCTLADAQQRRDIEQFALRIDRHPIAVAERALEAHRLAVDQNEFDLGMRHTERFDHVFGRRRARTAAGELASAPLGGKEVVQLGVETERRSDGHGCRSPRPDLVDQGRSMARCSVAVLAYGASVVRRGSSTGPPTVK
jgi:hypothetical protein